MDDLALLGLKPDVYSYTSDHFDTLLSLCERMIREGKAYADDTDPETVKKEREERIDSKNRNNCESLLVTVFLLGRLLSRLNKVGPKCPYILTYVHVGPLCMSVHNKFLRFQLNLACK